MKRRLQRWIAGVGVVLALSAILYAVAGRTVERPDRPVFSPQWEQCRSGDACIAIPAPCGEWQPVNATYEKDAAAYYGHLMAVVEETGMECVSTNLSTRKPAAYCRSGICTLGR